VIVSFALLAGYPTRMVLGTALAGTGLYIVSMADPLLLRLTVELRNAGLAFVDFLKQAVTLACVAWLASLIYGRSRASAGRVVVRIGFLGRVAAAARAGRSGAGEGPEQGRGDRDAYLVEDPRTRPPR
jgi:uncharacterized membrane protein